jgi:hypothetical protein
MTSSSDPEGQATRASTTPFKRLLFASLAVLVLAGAGVAIKLRPSAPPPAVPAAAVTHSMADSMQTQDGVIAYYFHTTYRCVSCRKIEAYSKLAIETAFAADLASGRLQWRMINIEDTGNEHFVKDYQLFTKSLVLSERRAGREVRWKNLPKVWELLNSEPAFVDYVQTETRAFLADAP